MINFDSSVCANFEEAARKEWLETNGLGGFASSTITGMNTRRYHALLVAALRPPTDRIVLLSKLEETLVIGGESFDLATNQYPEIIHPKGYQLLTNFRLDPFPIFTFRIGEIELEKSVFMLHGENTTVVRYRLKASHQQSATLLLRPLVAFRDYHSLLRESYTQLPQFEVKSGLVNIASGQEDKPDLLLAHNAASVLKGDGWYKRFEYREERARGFDYREDLYNPCILVFQMRGGDIDAQSVIASTEKHDVRVASDLEERERARRSSVVKAGNESDDFVRALRAAGEQFIVRRGAQGSSIIAGYHWFTDWGRDTMIALSGLTLATRNFNTARDILQAFAAYLSEGMIPNRFPDEGNRPDYNTVDATLWFVHAISEFLRRTNETVFVREQFYLPLKEIVDWHVRGTRYGIGVDVDNLLRAGVEGVQLTWMDAKVGNWVVTPRTGKAVEIQALWYNALRTIEKMAASFNDRETETRCGELAFKASESFNEKFWNDEAKCLFDVVRDDESKDAMIRPNQIFAVSLPYTMLSLERAKSVVEKVERELLTPFGLRSLSPFDENYRGRYEGDPVARDGAYHQGTVWAWLLGPFITAYLKVNNRTPESIMTAHSWTRGFQEHLFEAGLGQVSEIFDGDYPHAPRGCIAQAWSVGELLRCELEEFR